MRYKPFSLLDFLFFILILIFSCVGCRPIDNEINKPLHLDTYIHGDSIHQKLKTVDSLRFFGNYDRALAEYQVTLLSNDWSVKEENYLVLQHTIMRLFSGDTSISNQITALNFSREENKSPEEKFYHAFIMGKLSSLAERRKERTKWFGKCLSLFDVVNKEYFLKFHVLNEMGYYHRVYGQNIDSALFYYEIAQDLVDQYLPFNPITFDFLLRKADLYFITRDFASGLNHLEFVINNFQLEPKADSTLFLQAFLLKSKMLQYVNRNEEGDSLVAIIEPLIESQDNILLHANLYQQRALNAIRKNDSSTFISYALKLDKTSIEDLSGFHSVDRLYGYYHYSRGNYLKATEYYERMLEEFDSVGVFDMVQLMEGLYALSHGYANLGEFELSEYYAYQSLIFETSMKETPFNWENLMSDEVAGELYNFINYARLSETYLKHYLYGDGDVDELKKALKLYKLIDSIMLKQVNVVEEDAILNFLGIGHSIYSGAIKTLYHLYIEEGKEAYLDWIHYFSEQSKGLIIFRDILTNEHNLFPNVPESFRDKELQLKSTISSLKRSLRYISDSHKTEELRRLLEDQKKHHRLMKIRYPNYYEEKYNRKISTRRSLLELMNIADIGVVSFHTSNDELFRINHSRLGTTVSVIKIDSTFGSLVNRFKELVSQPSSISNFDQFQEFQDRAWLMYKILFDNMEISKRMIVIPDGLLHDFPFEAIITEPSTATEPNYYHLKYLAKKTNITYERSASAFLKNSSSNIDFSEARILAVSYSTREPPKSESTTQLPELFYSFRELESIEKHYGKDGNEFLVASNASREHFLKQVDKFDIVHLATHATSSTYDKLDNKILFRSESRTPEPLFGYEIFPLNLTEKLVVLSACRSNNGPFLPGEGTYSLTRAFEQAGASHVISSLWPINDYQTSQLFGFFYSNLKKEGDPGIALHKAKITYLERSDEYSAHPYFWAGLVNNGY